MAPTLLGAHARFTCDDCGYAFESQLLLAAAAASEQAIPSTVKHSRLPHRRPRLRRRDRRIDCPNCGYTVHDPDDTSIHDAVPIHYGDRILVLKYAYLLASRPALGRRRLQEPRRADRPASAWYTTNFIKRLVGRPGRDADGPRRRRLRQHRRRAASRT